MQLEFRTEKDVSDLELDVIFDREGLESLLSRLQWLEQQKTDHFHLFSEAWGTGDLTNAEEHTVAFNKVTFHVVDEKQT